MQIYNIGEPKPQMVETDDMVSLISPEGSPTAATAASNERKRYQSEITLDLISPEGSPTGAGAASAEHKRPRH
jgi:hypothetical protein